MARNTHEREIKEALEEAVNALIKKADKAGNT